MRERDGWGALYRACRSAVTPHGLRDPPPRPRLGPQPRARARRELEPDAVLIEGPPEADALLALAAHEDMAPPVALLTYVPDEPAPRRLLPVRALLARVARDPATRSTTTCPVRFMDLPAANKLAQRDGERRRGAGCAPTRSARWPRSPATATPSAGGRTSSSPRREGLGAFEAVTEAMARAARGVPGRRPARGAARGVHAPVDPRGGQGRGRERRRRLRRLARAGARRAGARRRPTQRTLRGLPKVKVAATWVPWTYGLLARESGYGAGVDSPAWYDQLFDDADEPVARWLARAARLLRERGPRRVAPRRSSTPSRLAGALAGIRDRPLAGPRRAARRDPRRALPRLRRAARARARGAGRRAPAGRGARATRRWSRSSRTSRALQRRLRLKPEAQREGAHARPAARDRPRAQPAAAPPEPARRAVGRAARRARGQGTFKEAFRLEWQPGARARADPRRPLGDDRRRPPRPRGPRAQAAEQERDRRRWPTLADAVLLADLPGRARGRAARARRPRRAGPRHRRPDGRRPAAGRRSCATATCAGATRAPVAGVLRGHRAAQRGRAAGRGRRRRRGDRRDSSRELVDGVNSALALLEDDDAHARVARGAAARRRRRPAARARSPAAPPGCCTTRASSSPRGRAMSRALSPGEEPERGATLDRGLHRHERARARPRPRAARDPRRLGRGRPPGRLHQRPAAAAPRVLRPARRASAAASASALQANLKGPGPFTNASSTRSARGGRALDDRRARLLRWQ